MVMVSAAAVETLTKNDVSFQENPIIGRQSECGLESRGHCVTVCDCYPSDSLKFMAHGEKPKAVGYVGMVQPLTWQQTPRGTSLQPPLHSCHGALRERRAKVGVSPEEPGTLCFRAL